MWDKHSEAPLHEGQKVVIHNVKTNWFRGITTLNIADESSVQVRYIFITLHIISWCSLGMFCYRLTLLYGVMLHLPLIQLLQPIMALTVCLSHASVVSKWPDESSWVMTFKFHSTCSTLCCKKIQVISIIRVLPSDTLSQTLDLQNFPWPCWSLQCVINIVCQMSMLIVISSAIIGSLSSTGLPAIHSTLLYNVSALIYG